MASECLRMTSEERSGMRVLVSGGAGFIGSTLVRQLLAETDWRIANIDKLTYAADPQFARMEHPRYDFIEADICDPRRVQEVFDALQPDAVLHLAAETHVDRSIAAPQDFVQSNVAGTATLLAAANAYCAARPGSRDKFRFLHVSTDEVYGPAGEGDVTGEGHPYRPSSPYAASKAASDHLVRAWWTTYGLPTLITNSCNTYGPYQSPDKLIPVLIKSALSGRALPLYGDGSHRRTWIHAEDHCRALRAALRFGRPGESYNVSTGVECTNLDLAERICSLLDELRPRPDGASYRAQIAFVDDRPGHDRAYRVDAAKLGRDCRWQPQVDFATGLRETVLWYLDNEDWAGRAERRLAAT